jgi:hypothetical protein
MVSILDTMHHTWAPSGKFRLQSYGDKGVTVTRRFSPNRRDFTGVLRSNETTTAVTRTDDVMQKVPSLYIRSHSHHNNAALLTLMNLTKFIPPPHSYRFRESESQADHLSSVKLHQAMRATYSDVNLNHIARELSHVAALHRREFTNYRKGRGQRVP